MKTHVFARCLGAALLSAALSTSASGMAGDPRPTNAEADPVHAAPLYKAGMDLMDQKKYADACPKFAEARRLDPNMRNALIALAKCYDLAGKTASAWAKYQELSFEFKKAGSAAGEEAARKRGD